MTKIEKTEHIVMGEVSSQATLHPGQGITYGTEPIHIPDAALEIIHNLNKDQKKRLANYLLGYAGDSDVWNQGVDYSEHNKAGIRGHGDYVTNKKELEKALEQIELPPDLKAKATKLFEDAIVNIAFQDDPLREGLSELLGDPLYSLLMDEEGISVVELLSAYQDYLLEQIEYVENCNLAVQEELKNKLLTRHAAWTEHLDLYEIQQLWSSCESLEDFEDGLEQMRQSHSSSHRRSTVNELMNEPNEDNYDAYFNENHSGNARMRSYVAKLEQTTRH